MIALVQQGLRSEGVDVSISQMCRWFGEPRRSVYYQATKSAPKLQAQLVEPVKVMIEENPSFGYRTVAHLLSMNKNTVQRIFQIKGWQVARGLWAFDLAFKLCHRWPRLQMSAGLLICAEYGRARMAGPH
ncbi:hypothetical protein [Lampropedia aestuarii]|uniref:hypothetical protein n=1 Tax=Lampropedia aestuarii TaxID=2562762 RepID=UPI0024684E56|nr:hypothetical protein [Lampropedia aestuarii]MDH5858362.1 hypothetical protein [Lampropedia aestuarii]